MAFINRIRLPFKISKPQFPEDREVYRKANGEIKVLSAIIRKQYDGVTDYWPEPWHERFKIALSHDQLEIEGEKYTGRVVQEGSYDIEWPDFLDYPLGQAKFKVLVTPFNARYSNCGTCEEYSQVVCEDDDIGTIGEDETVIVPILYNDAICCSPFVISLVTYNSTYLDSCTVIGNTLQIHTKTGIPIQNNVVLATYRVTCENGMYDEANVIANVEGSIVECLSPTNLLVSAGSITASATWDAPSPEPACGYSWNLYLASDLGTPVQSGSEPTTAMGLTGLTASTNYVLMVAADCCDEDLSPFVSAEFTTEPSAETGICGEYELCFSDAELSEESIASVQYINCSGDYQTKVIPNFTCQTICALQTGPNDPVSIDPITFDVEITYLGLC